MPSATFVFDDQTVARRAARDLIDGGLRPQAVRLHTRDQTPEPSPGAEAEEIITGGILHSFGELLQGLQDWGHPQHAAGAYADVVERGGAVVIVDAANASEEAQTDALMNAVQPIERTGWAG